MKKQNKKKIIALIVSMVFVIALSISSVSAYLTAKTDPIENTFTAITSLIKESGKFTLNETKNYQMGTEGFELVGQEKTNTGVSYLGVMPGMTIAKDPTISVDLATTAHIFLKVVATNMTAAADYNAGGDLYDWQIGAGWELINEPTTVAGVTTYLYVMDNVPSEQVTTNIPILEQNKVNVANYTASVEDVALANEGASLVFSAYAIQAFQVDVSDTDKALEVFEANF